MQQQRHATLPQNLSAEELQKWIMRVAVERFKDTTKRYFTEEEVQQFEHESSVNGRHINRLKGILKTVTEAVNKGVTEDLAIVIPKNDGCKNYDNFRHQNDELIEAGFEEIPVDVFGIVNQDNEVMEYFTLDDTNIEERTRPLSAKERKEYLTVRHMAVSSGNASDAGQQGAGEQELGRTAEQ